MHFNSLEDEMEFWDTHDATDFEAKEVTAAQVISTLSQEQRMKKITLRFEIELYDRLKHLAAERNISYSALVRELLWKEVHSI